MCLRKNIVLVSTILALLAIPIIYAHAASLDEIQSQINSIMQQIATLINSSGQASLNSSSPVCIGTLIGSDCTKAGGKFVCTGCSTDTVNCTALPCSCVCSPCANEGELSYMATSAYEKQPHSCCAGLTAVMNAEYTGSTCAAPGNGTQRCVKYGDGKCDKGKGENECNSLKDCPYPSPVCGNSQCETGETATSCPQDCGKSCEESCKAQGYTYSACNSYAVTAGTSQCKEGYTSIGQAKDCYVTPGTTGAGKACCCTNPNPICGNGKCETNETAANCPKDCGNKCEMASTDTNPLVCRKTCNEDEATVDTSCDGNGSCCKKTMICGNSQCETGETATSCPQDCGKSCEESCKAQGYTYSACNSYAVTAGTSQCKEGYTSVGPTKDCYAIPGTVGNGKACCCTKESVPTCKIQGSIFEDTSAICCDSLQKNTYPSSCSSAAPCTEVVKYICNRCGDKFCEFGENEKNCAADCIIKPSCGNGFCETGETAENCAKDCGNKCEMANTEAKPLTCRTTCNVDEAAVDTSCDGNGVCCKKTRVCGNSLCETGETAADCPQDCGKSCEESCKAQSYTYSYCNSYAITADASLSKCKQGYTSIGAAKDCYVPTGLVGAGKACCCTTSTPVCAAEGERIFAKDLANGKPTACCLNLTAISSCADNGACPDNGSSVCTNCGNGTCGKGENKVNCPKDCGTNKCEMASTATNPLTCRTACNANETLVDISCNGSLTCCKQTPVCAKAGETIVSAGAKCCAGLVAQTPDGCLESEGCKPDSWICKNKHTDILAEINKIKGEIKQMMQRLQELMKELR